MKYFYWFVVIILGVAMIYTPRINFVLPEISLGVVVMVLGVFGLARSLFHS